MTHKRILALLLAIMFIFSVQTFVLADGIPFTFAVSIPDSERSNGIFAGQTVKATVELIFDDTFSSISQGVRTMQFGFRFDPTVMELVDGDTNELLEFDENGEVISGLLYHYDAIGMESQLTAILENNKKSILCTYISNVDGSADIYSSGAFIHFYFKAKKDLAITDITSTAFQITSPYIGCNAEDFDYTILTEDVGISIKPPFEFTILGQPRQGESILISGNHFVSTDEDPLVLSITKDGEEVIPSEELDKNGVFFQKQLLLDEEIFIPGYYRISLSHKDFSLSKTFNIQEKIPEPTPKPTVEPTPTPSVEPEPTEEPTPTVTPTADPTETPAPTAKPTSAPTPTVKPTATPSAKPSTESSRPVATSTPVPSDEEIEDEATSTPSPSATDKENNGEEPTVSGQYPSDIGGHWAEVNVKYVYANSLMNGYSDGTFGPDNKITRAEFATVMARFLGLADAPDKASHFTDCENHWAKGYIGALVDKGIVNGVSDVLFAPDSTVTREQIALILSRTLALSPVHSEEKYADDALISSWAYDGVYSIFAAGIMKGDTNGNFSPLAGATRAEVATILYRLHSKEK